MSVSSFHHHFKQLTSMMPLQYQKQLRLPEVKRLMVAEIANVTRAALHVGYERASQFSRKYVRMFRLTLRRESVWRSREAQAQTAVQVQRLDVGAVCFVDQARFESAGFGCLQGTLDDRAIVGDRWTQIEAKVGRVFE
ncbi:helix-turn-helix domain-containing protein [Duganella sp. FT134W]|uniref:Helix-turn-helix domain-containing protein n=1 Tax=Duganella margarita TaxID=2692170 RepID=A0A7X4H152_9BURK|nr:helix-turn-helix domain-containing protein [Duganella margarita]